MYRILAVLALFWIAILPPFFTNGACTVQFDKEAARVEADSHQLSTVASVEAYLNSRGISYSRLSQEQCQRAHLRGVEHCAVGALVYATVPVENRVCRLYRDDAIRIQFHFNRGQQLAGIQTDLDPFKSLPIPFTKTSLYWAR